MTDYTELIKALRHCSTHALCDGCPREDYCTKNDDAINIGAEAADAIEELLAVLGNIASAVFYYGDDPGLSEIIMRKLWKVGIVKMDGDLWVWNTPTKEVNNETD